MKKMMVFGFMVLLLMGQVPAFAEEESTTTKTDAVLTALTTKDYVDKGLKYVYKNAANANYSDAVNYKAGTVGAEIKNIKNKANNPAAGAYDNKDSGLTADTIQGAIDELADEIDNLPAGTTYEGGVGIEVENGKVGLKGVTASAAANKTFVFKDGSWQELEVEDEWTPDFLGED